MHYALKICYTQTAMLVWHNFYYFVVFLETIIRNNLDCVSLYEPSLYEFFYEV